MDFGIFNIMQQRDLAKSAKQIFDEAAEQTLIAEQLGFARAWYAEHHFSNYSLCPSPLRRIGVIRNRIGQRQQAGCAQQHGPRVKRHFKRHFKLAASLACAKAGLVHVPNPATASALVLPASHWRRPRENALGATDCSCFMVSVIAIFRS